jgi:exodeoxyribonuclease-3
MTFSIATWNINSVRLRMPLVERFLREHQPDVLCLQETKCPNDQFPSSPLTALGYEHLAIHGQKGYHGVAIVSRHPLGDVERHDYCAVGDSRHISAEIAAGRKRIRIHNFYVPAGGDEPDRNVNAKFGHKLDFIEEMKALRADGIDGVSSLLVGDLNVAPHEHDVWSHKQLLNVVSHTPVETAGLIEVINRGNWLDLMRLQAPEPQKLYTWWSYRSPDWAVSDRGRRLDHIWSSADLGPSLQKIDIVKDARGWEKPSDHVPVIAFFDI